MTEKSGVGIHSGERPLEFFVSSVMTKELQWARDTTVEVLRSFTFAATWAFEYTPASSDKPEQAYLRKVREADFVILLLADHVTPPVINEIQEAQACNVRILMIILPSDDRSPEVKAMIEELKSSVKYGYAGNSDSLHALINLTFGDEFTRAIRGTPDKTRVAVLDQMLRASRERMIQHWVATGITRIEALDFAENLSSHEISPGFIPNSDMPVKILVGEVGAGKSLIAERIFQAAVRDAKESVNAPIPMFLHARDCIPSLQNVVQTSSNGLGDPRVLGVYLVIDGLDEVPSVKAADIVAGADVLARSFPDNTCILITSRPIAAIQRSPTRVSLPLLSRDEARSLIQKVLGAAPPHWSSNLDETLRCPLFAILYAMELRQNPQNAFTEGNLISLLVENAIGRDRDTLELGTELLQKLAVLSTEVNGSPVRVAELGNIFNRNNLAKSRIVVESHGTIGFALPIFTQWFAAQSLFAGEPSLDSLFDDPTRLDRWRSAIVIAISSGSRDFVNTFMERLANKDPAFAAQVLYESVTSLGNTSGTIRRSWLEIGGELKDSFENWLDGIAPLGELIFPHYRGSRLDTVTVDVSDGWVTWGWHDRSEQSEDVVRMPGDVTFESHRPGWTMVGSKRWNDDPGRSWKLSHSEIYKYLKPFIDHKALPVDDPGILHEAVWLFSLTSNEWVEDSGLVALGPILEELQHLEANQLIRCYDRNASVGLMRNYVNGLINKGIDLLGPPWPQPDQGNNYSESQELERITAVLLAAIKAYEAIVNTWFPKLAKRMQTMAILPARFVGEYLPSSANPYGVSSLDWHWEPLQYGKASSVDISIQRNFEKNTSWEEMQSLFANNRQNVIAYRPDSSSWLSISLTNQNPWHFFNHAPVGEIAYSWLENDLGRISWYT